MDNRNPSHNSPRLISTSSARQRFSPISPITPSTVSASVFFSGRAPVPPPLRTQMRPPPSPSANPLPSPSRSRLDPEYSARLRKTLTVDITSPSFQRNDSRYDSVFGSTASPSSFSDSSTRRSFVSGETFFNTPERPHSSNNTNVENSFSFAASEAYNTTPSKVTPANTGYSDRFIPSRSSSNLFMSLKEDKSEENSVPRNEQPQLLNALLKSELLGQENSSPQRKPITDNHFKFQSPKRTPSKSSMVKTFDLSPVSNASSQRLIASPVKRKRRIAKVPFKVLDAPALQDDFYLNLVDWSSLNVLAVGLGSCVYLWSACTSKVTKLCDLSSSEDIVTSVSWTQRGTHLAVGTNRGHVQIWDSIKCKKVRTMGGHSARIGTLSWNGPTLASGSRDRMICFRDVRCQDPFSTRLVSHKQEVCGLKWSFDEPAQLASGGNDNKLLVWDIKNTSHPVHRFAEHTAAVKAIAWSPHQHGLLASGGGTADRCIRFWNTLSGTRMSCVDTGSQVCNLAWSHNCNELVSTHGYSLNQIVVWRYPSMTKVATLTGHTYRVLYLAVSPDGSTIVTGAGDETLRFWQVFPGPRSHDKSTGSGLLFPPSPGSVVR